MAGAIRKKIPALNLRFKRSFMEVDYIKEK
jgi:hypothetical protein